MTRNKLYLPLEIFGEDVIIDYHNEDVIFPNRLESKTKLRSERVAAISHYLKAEGFLNTVDLASFEPWELPHLGSSGGELLEGLHSSTFARVSYVREIGRDRVLAGFMIPDYIETDLSMEDFELEKLGEVECWGTYDKAYKLGWAVYTQFNGNSGDQIPISEERHQCG
jgi:hypothetical protein